LDILEGLAALVDKSLLRQEAQPDGAPRFWMLDTIREYGLEQLGTSGEIERTQRRHAAFFVGLAERVNWHGPEQEVWLQRLEQEHDNLRAVLRWSAERRDAETGLGLGSAIWFFWERQGYLREGQQWLEAALSYGAGAPASLRARALHGAGGLARDLGEYDRAAGFLEAALALRRELGDTRGIANSLNILGNIAAHQGDYGRAASLHEESLALFRELGDKWRTAILLDNLGVDAGYQGDHERAKALHRESLTLLRELGDRRDMANVLNNLAVRVRLQGDYAQAAALGQESLKLFQEVGSTRGMALALKHLGAVARDQGDDGRAIALCKESLAVLQEWEDKPHIADCLELAAAVEAQGEPDRAARLFGAAEVLRERTGSPLDPSERANYARHVATVRSSLREELFAAAWAEGRMMPLEQAIQYALATVEPGPPVAPVTEKPPVSRPPGSLTPREQEVAALIARGMTNREIATGLVITEGTVEVHVQHILNKLRVHSRTQIAVWGVGHGLVKSSRTD
jgi:DNA-binding CsgD family transcriptional regulator/tetratricopeptide (TPR) repeat protein